MNGAIPRCGLIVLVALAACSPNPPYHRAPQTDASTSVQCTNAYKRFDDAIGRIQPARVAPTATQPECASSDENDRDGDKLAACLKANLKDDEFPTQDAPCWSSSWEQHLQYDLFFTEFDDEGWAADVRLHPEDHVTEQDVLFEHLDALAKGPDPLDIVVFTHGWHGSPKPDNYYVVLFRAFLNSLAQLDAASDTHRRVIGVYVGWRGDSIIFPTRYAKYLSPWDRKQAAETVSAGEVQGLFERMHRFYLDNSCHVRSDGTIDGNTSRCGRVRMLTISHSFGTLIDFRSLLGNMETGLGRTDKSRVYAFGDLVVMLNPAFEGTRYEPLFADAMHRGKFIGPAAHPDNGGAQLPVVVTLQSEGDGATHHLFPIFRHVTSAFENAVGTDEKDDSIHAVGWVDAFATHRLCLANPGASSSTGDPGKDGDALCAQSTAAPDDGCDNIPSGNPPPDYRLRCRVALWKGKDADDAYIALSRPSVYMGNGISLLQLKDRVPPLPQYFPYWVVKVDKRIMADHDDIWNTKTTDVILQIYRTVVEQSDIQAAVIRATAPALPQR